MTIEEVALAAPGQGEITVRLKACAICHSDILYAEGAWGGQLPAVYGHEAAGIVEAVGADVQNAAVGDHVIVTLIRACGHCHYCGDGQPTQCQGETALSVQGPLSDGHGAPVKQGLNTGGFAEAVTVHASQVQTIDKDVPMDAASLLSCGVITGLGAVVNTVKMRPGQDCVVIGCGGVGLNAVQGAALCGARRIIAIDISDDKIETAKAFGATHGVNPKSGDVVAQVRELSDGLGVDFAFVTVGAKPVMEQAPQFIKRGAAVVLVGMTADGVTIDLDALSLTDAGQRIIGSKMGQTNLRIDIPWLVAQYKAGRLKLDDLISGRYALEDINTAIDEVKSGAALRNVIVFD